MGKSVFDFTRASLNGIPLPGTPKQRAQIINAMKKRGMKVGESDLFIAIPLSGLHGLFIEVKFEKRSPVAQEQKDFRDLMRAAGYGAEIAVGLQGCIDAWTAYVSRGTIPLPGR